MTPVLADTRNNHSRRTALREQRRSESGITILEMVVSMMILTIGLLGLAAAIGYAVTVSNKGRNVTNSKLLVVSILEQTETLRNTSQLTFGQIANTGQQNNTGATRAFGGFPDTFMPVSINPGPDGIWGTDDDLRNPGNYPGAVYGDGDDFDDPTWAAAGFSRQILITNLNSDLKRVQVTLRYPDVNGQTQQLVGVSYLNNDDRTTFR
jgi:type II secretory pathway pseudopilin PulG